MSVSTETPAAGEPSITERLVGALSDTWRAIQARHPDVPDVVLTLGSGSSGRRGTTKLGHFARRRWVKVAPAGADAAAEGADVEHVHELLIGGEGLVDGPEELLGTLLHEGAHARAEALGISDTSRDYHNVRFKTLAEEMGLRVAEAGYRGWADTTVAPATVTDYRVQVDALTSAITAYRVPMTTRPAGSPSTSRMLAAVCGCEAPRRMRIASRTFELGGITCDLCGEHFRLAT